VADVVEGTNNQVTASDLGGISYDAAGNSIGVGSLSGSTYDKYVYDLQGRVCAVYHDVAGVVKMTQYVYDADGQRVARGAISTWPGAGSSCALPSGAGFTLTSVFVRTPGDNQETELTQSGSTITGWHQNVYAAGSLLATYTSQGGSTPTLTFSINDWLSTKRVEINTAGVAVAYWKSDPFGNYLSQVGSGTDATENHYTGKERDSESGLDYFGAS
jgi:hypothetical protein